MTFTAPVQDIRYALEHMARPQDDGAPSALGDLDDDLLNAVLAEAGRFASEVVAPLNRVGDTQPSVLDQGRVTTPPGWKSAYAKWQEAGWNGLHFPAELGGQALPFSLNVAVADMINAACMAFSLGPLLTQGAAQALAEHGSDRLKTLFLQKMVSGEWTGTMNLTEPQAGSDLAALKTRAEPAGDGTYRITGQKIYITHGEHEWTENIVHLVLARLPDAPPGTKGISLFLVPKVLVGDDGSLAARNDLQCIRLEHKLGIHGSPTCVMAYGQTVGATGYLVGEENQGLACMFTMMNNARLMVGVQGVGIAERATQQATAYAAERHQGRLAGDGPDVSVPIHRHPDVQRMLLTMRALTMAARGICYAAAREVDAETAAPDPERRAAAGRRVDLLTPIVKAYCTDVAVEVASLGIQVHGGMGFMEETGAAQHLRDARILPIYEGTNGIQAIDLAMRKVARDGGAEAAACIREIREIARDASAVNDPAFGRIGERLSEAADDLAAATGWLVETAAGEPEAVLAVATPYLRLFALTAGGAFLARGALGVAATGAGKAEPAGDHAALARFYCESLLPEVGALRTSVTEGARSVLDHVMAS